MFLVSLCSSSMRLGVPFIAPRKLGAVEGQQGRPSLPSVEWRTRQSEREMCPWAISKYFGDLVPNTSA
jgi:hypothetical protein